jgi:hypothetical protein
MIAWISGAKRTQGSSRFPTEVQSKENAAPRNMRNASRMGCEAVGFLAGSSLMPSFNWHERSDELNRVRQQGNGDHDAGKEGRIYAETANAPPDCPCDCDNDSHDHGRENKLHAVILADRARIAPGGERKAGPLAHIGRAVPIPSPGLDPFLKRHRFLFQACGVDLGSQLFCIAPCRPSSSPAIHCRRPSRGFAQIIRSAQIIERLHKNSWLGGLLKNHDAGIGS